MQYRFGEPALNGAILFLLGLCTGISIAENNISVTNITGVILSATAIYGISTWKHQIDYKERKDDKRHLTKTIKLLDTYLALAMKETAFPINEIANIGFESINTEIASNKIPIKESRNSLQKAIELQSEIESELATNSIVKKAEKLHSKVQKLLLNASDLIEILGKSDQILSDCLKEDILSVDIFEKLNNKIDERYKKYFKQNLEVEIELGIFHSTQLRISLAKDLGMLDD